MDSMMFQMFLEQIGSITAMTVERYLALNHWCREKKFPNPNLMVFEHHESHKRIALPSSEKFDDFYRCLFFVIPSIACWEGKDMKEVVDEMNALQKLAPIKEK